MATATPPNTPAPGDPAAANQLGLAALRGGDFGAAARHFAAAVAADPAAGSLWRNLAHARRELGDDAGERAALDGALALDRTDFTAWLRKAQLHERLGERRDALIAWDGVVQMAATMQAMPPPLSAMIDHGRAYCAAQRDKTQRLIDTTLAPELAALDATSRRRADVFMRHALGQRPVYANVCAGLYYPFLPADEFFDAHHFPWFAALAAAVPEIRAECLDMMTDPSDALRPYVRMEAGTPHNKWSPLDHKLDWSACFLWEYGRPNPAVLDRCPATAAALAALPQAHIPDRAPSAFFSILQPHTRIPPHTGVTNTRAIVHVPLIIPPGCGFRVGGETRTWDEGVPFAFDDTIEHEAWNDSNSARAVLIFDVWNPHLSAAEQDMICRYHASADVL